MVPSSWELPSPRSLIVTILRYVHPVSDRNHIKVCWLDTRGMYGVEVALDLLTKKRRTTLSEKKLDYRRR
jgi:hypothetical protein